MQGSYGLSYTTLRNTGRKRRLWTRAMLQRRKSFSASDMNRVGDLAPKADQATPRLLAVASPHFYEEQSCTATTSAASFCDFIGNQLFSLAVLEPQGRSLNTTLGTEARRVARPCRKAGFSRLALL